MISRLSTTAFRGREATLAEISAHLNANYVLSGAYRADDRRVTLDAELAEAKSGRILWGERLKDRGRRHPLRRAGADRPASSPTSARP